MMRTLSTLDTATLMSDSGKWYVPVPWECADNLHQHLRQQGCPSTLCLDPEPHEARLELWPGVDPNRVRQALEELLAGDRLRHAAAV